MKVSFRKIVLWLMVIIIVAVVLVRPGAQTGKYLYQIETVSNKCTFDENPEQDIRAVRDSIVITMPMQAPTPCYEATGDVNFFGSDIVVNLQTKQVGETCVQCIGVVVAKVTISNLDDGVYGLQVNAPDKAIITTVKIE